jgi:hypothetical protein
MTARWPVVTLAAALSVSMTTCTEDGLDRAAVDAVEGTDELLRSVATDGVTSEAAPVVAARAVADSPAALCGQRRLRRPRAAVPRRGAGPWGTSARKVPLKDPRG